MSTTEEKELVRELRKITLQSIERDLSALPQDGGGFGLRLYRNMIKDIESLIDPAPPVSDDARVEELFATLETEIVKRLPQSQHKHANFFLELYRIARTGVKEVLNPAPVADAAPEPARPEEQTDSTDLEDQESERLLFTEIPDLTREEFIACKRFIGLRRGVIELEGKAEPAYSITPVEGLAELEKIRAEDAQIFALVLRGFKDHTGSTSPVEQFLRWTLWAYGRGTLTPESVSQDLEEFKEGIAMVRDVYQSNMKRHAWIFAEPPADAA